METVRQCWTCKLEFPLELFPKHKSSANGRLRHCTKCHSDQNKKRVKKFVEKCKTIVPTISFKICRRCEIEKSTSDFYKTTYSADKYSPICKTCKSDVDRNYRLRHNDELKLKRKANCDKEKPFLFYKVCYTCKIERSRSAFGIKSYRTDGLDNNCKFCRREIENSLSKNAKRKEYHDKYKKLNKEKLYLQRKAREERQKRFYELNHTFISDTYAKQLFRHHKLKEVPKELIEVKKVLLKIKREVIEK